MKDLHSGAFYGENSSHDWLSIGDELSYKFY